MVLNLFKFLTPGAMKPKKVGSSSLSAIKKEWDKIDNLLKAGGTTQLTQALIGADKSMDNALRDIVAGETMGERLKNASKKFDRTMYDKIWKAHKLRNAVVHESGFEPAQSYLRSSIEDIRRGLYQIGVRV